jgi:hypothetical protein
MPLVIEADGLGEFAPGEAVAGARPDELVHQLSAIDASKPDLEHPDRWAATTNRLRTEGTDHQLTAAGWPGSGAATWADGRPAPRAGASA